MTLSSPICILLMKTFKKKRIESRKWELQSQFKDGIQSISNALNTGYSIENSFGEAIKDLSLLYEKDALIIKEFRYIQRQISMNKNVEELILEFGRRSGIDDILSFAEIIRTAKRTGGDLIKVIRITSDNISERMEIQREIKTLITAKKLEGNIMSLLPVFIIVYLRICMPGFLMPLYSTLIGRMVMTGALVTYAAAVWLLQKIINIQM